MDPGTFLSLSSPESGPVSRGAGRCGHASPLPIKWLSGWAYHGSCRGCQLTCGVTPTTAASPCVVGGGVGWAFVSPWHPFCPRPPAHMHRVIMCCAPLWIFGGAGLPVRTHTLRVPGAWQGLENKSHGSNRKREQLSVKAAATGIQGSVTSFYGWRRQPLPWHHPISSNVTRDVRADILWLDMGGGGGGLGAGHLVNCKTQIRKSMCILSGPIAFYQLGNKKLTWSPSTAQPES